MRFAKIVVSKDEKTKELSYAIQLLEKDNLKKIEDVFNEAEGILKNIYVEKYEFPKDSGIMKPVLVLEMEDEETETIYRFRANFSYPIRSFINGLLNEHHLPGKKLMFRTYVKDENPRIYSEIDGEKTSWLYAGNELPEVRVYQGRGGAEEIDDTPLNDFFYERVIEIIQPQFKQAEKDKAAKGENEPESQQDDDLPF